MWNPSVHSFASALNIWFKKYVRDKTCGMFTTMHLIYNSLSLVFTGQEQGIDETSGCPLKRKKVWPDRKFTAVALTIGRPVGNNTERLHCCNTVKVSLLCFVIAIYIDYFLIGKARDHVVHGKSIVESKKPFSKCQHILDILWRLFHWIIGCDFGLGGGWSPHF